MISRRLLLAALSATPLLARGQGSDGVANLRGASADYTRVQRGMQVRLPADYAAKPEFRQEWWYLTGQLDAANGHHYGFQHTIFRRALRRGPLLSDGWDSAHVFLVHFAISDSQTGQHLTHERYWRARRGAVAHAPPPQFELAVASHRLQALGEGFYPLQLVADAGVVRLELTLQSRKQSVRHGIAGYSAKNLSGSEASLYFSDTRLAGLGRLRLAAAEHEVQASAWFDREWSTSALADGQRGWVWYALQLDDGSELMVYALERVDGSIDTASYGAYIAADGGLTQLRADQFALSPTRWWTSPDGGAQRYPIAHRIEVTELGLQLTSEATFADQLWRGSIRYWEGAVRASGERAGRAVRARGYLEIAGARGA